MTEERTRIARELRESLAHGLSVIALQTSAIDAALDDPEGTRERASALADVGEDPLAAIDAQGFAVQVLSLAPPGTQGWGWTLQTPCR